MNKEIEQYLTTNYYELLEIAEKLTKTTVDNIHKELLHECILQLYDKEHIKLKSYDNNSIKYYITAVMRTNYFSKTSPFYYRIRRARIIMNVDISTCYDLEYEQENFEKEELYQLLEQEYCELTWFQRSLMDMYLTLNSSMKAVSRKTSIPISSISRYFKEIRTETKERIINKLNK
jgi:hypothetical protein